MKFESMKLPSADQACSEQQATAPESHEDDHEDEDVDAEIESDMKLPSDPARALEEDEPERDAPEYGDLIDSGWIERAARIEDLDDDGGVSLEVGITLDVGQWDSSDELGQVVDVDIGPLLAALPVEGELDNEAGARELGSHDAALAAGALSELLLPDRAEPDAMEEDGVDERRFPAFDDSTLPLSRRPDADVSDPDDHEGPET